MARRTQVRDDIAVRRLHAQRLSGEPSTSAPDLVRWMGAVQAQDYAGAKWALAQRLANTTDAQLDQLFDAGAILRTHLLRPTWHFAAPDDIRWLLDLTGPRVLAGVAHRHRELEIDGRLMARAKTVTSRALVGGRALTRAELFEILRRARVAADGSRLYHVLVRAELEGHLVSGPRRGKQHTWALLEERAPGARRLEREQAIAELTRRYFQSHGPAQVQDFVWWSGLTTADTRLGLAQLGDVLERRVIAEKEYWFAGDAPAPASRAPVAHLLPNFDEYTVAYRDRAAILHPARAFDPTLFSFGSVLANVVTIGGLVLGAWRRTAAGKDLRIEVRPLGRVSPVEASLVEGAGERLSRYLGRPVDLRWL